MPVGHPCLPQQGHTENNVNITIKLIQKRNKEDLRNKITFFIVHFLAKKS